MANSPVPDRSPNGLSTDNPWGPLADYGNHNPFFYNEVEDDFTDSLAVATRWTKTLTGNGTVANAAGDGGLALFTTNNAGAAGTDIASIQMAAANFAIRPLLPKVFMLCRLQLADVVNAALLVGLIQTTATPFTVVDGLAFLKASGSASNLILRSTVASVNTDLVIPTSAYTLTNNVNVDLGFYIDRNGRVVAFVGSNIIGFKQIPGTGTTPPSRGPSAAFATNPTLTTANLNLTLALQSGTASSKTMTADCIMAAKER